MKHLSLARLALAPAFVGLLAGAAMAQTQQEQGSGSYGIAWSNTVGDRFYTDDTFTILRSDAEITAAWAELPEADRTLVMADCKLVKTHTGEPIVNDGADAGKADKATGTPVSDESIVKLCKLVDPS